MPEEVKQLIQQYQEGTITRREFIRRAVAITGSFAAATIGRSAPKNTQSRTY